MSVLVFWLSTKGGFSCKDVLCYWSSVSELLGITLCFLIIQIA